MKLNSRNTVTGIGDEMMKIKICECVKCDKIVIMRYTKATRQVAPKTIIKANDCGTCL